MLQAIMMFSVCGSRTEMMGDRHNAYSMYIETLSLIKFLTKLTNSSRNNNQDVDPRYRIAAKSWIPFMFCIFRLVVLSLRAQSLLNLKLYKMKRHELKDYQKTIQDVLAKSEEDPSTSSEGQSRTEQMSTPSPAGSEGSNCSKVSKYIFLCLRKYFYFPLFQSSDYYSSGENRLPGVLTPPTAPPICLSIPRNVMQNQYNFCSYLSQCHELWEQADIHVVRDVRGACEGEYSTVYRLPCLQTQTPHIHIQLRLNLTIVPALAFYRCFASRFLHPAGPGVRPPHPPLLAQGPGQLHEEGA